MCLCVAAVQGSRCARFTCMGLIDWRLLGTPARVTRSEPISKDLPGRKHSPGRD